MWFLPIIILAICGTINAKNTSTPDTAVVIEASATAINEIKSLIKFILIPSEVIILSSSAKILHSFAKSQLIISNIGSHLRSKETSSQFFVPRATVLKAVDVVEFD